VRSGPAFGWVNSARSSAVTRHTFGSRLIQQGESLAYVKEQMGHASIQSPIKQSKHSSDSKC